MTYTYIYEANTKNYTKTGKLHKRAIAFYKSEDHSAEDDAQAIKRWFSQCGLEIESVGKPYIVSHLEIVASGKRYYLYQEYKQDGWPNAIVCTPESLYKALTI